MEALLPQDSIDQQADRSNAVDLPLLESLKVRAKYRPGYADVRYSASEQDVAMNLAVSTFGPLSTVPVLYRDLAWETDGCSEVRRYELEDGTAGYFKSFKENSGAEYAFKDYGMSSLGSSISDLNSYRMAQLLGRGFDELVPETVLREIDGQLGTLQREVIEATPREIDSEVLRGDYRRASIFDFVTGNLDRHDENFLYGADGQGRARIRLIDNSFSFPGAPRVWMLNENIFADNHPSDGDCGDEHRMLDSELTLTLGERLALKRARQGVQGWIDARTIAVRRGKATLKRIDYLLKVGRLGGFTEYFHGICGWKGYDSHL